MNNKSNAQLHHAPLLVEINRGRHASGEPIVECVHHGIISVVNSLGESLFNVGDVSTMCHLRSTAKPVQILPLFKRYVFLENGPSWNSQLKLSDVALLISSHAGEPIHTTRVQELLQIIGLKDDALRCGIHPPQDDATRKAMLFSHDVPSVLHNNCSGKHTAMLMVCLIDKLDMTSYENERHPLQQEIKDLIKTLGDVANHDISFGVDGCSLPTWAIPLQSLALIYSRLSAWQTELPKSRPSFLKDAFLKIWSSATTYPENLAGTKRFDTELIRASGGKIFSKTGADGMHALAVLPDKNFPHGLGVAIKIADGDARQTIRPLVIKELLNKFNLWPRDDSALQKFMPSFKNFRGICTGDARVIL